MEDDAFAIYEAKCQAAAALKEQLLPQNKTILFDVLAAAGITLVTLDFDGYGDSGQFEDLHAFGSENVQLELPQTDIVVQTVDLETSTASNTSMTVRDHLGSLACDFLESTHSGWEDGEGAYGQFKFCVEERTIALEYSERYVDTYYHEHVF